jgi:hypothetical protein
LTLNPSSPGGPSATAGRNAPTFLAELCDVLDVPRPDQASHDASTNAYAFERAVTFREPDGSTARGRIDLYRRGSFVLEAKQSRRPGAAKAVPEQGDLLAVRRWSRSHSGGAPHHARGTY